MRFVFSICAIYAFLILSASAGAVGYNAVHSEVVVLNADGSSERVVFEADWRVRAPCWSPDGSTLQLNWGGRLWSIAVDGSGDPRTVSVDVSGWIDINHGVSPDGRSLAVTTGDGSLWIKSGGGSAVKLPSGIPGYFHGWSPDGKGVVYSGNRGQFS